MQKYIDWRINIGGTSQSPLFIDFHTSQQKLEPLNREIFVYYLRYILSRLYYIYIIHIKGTMIPNIVDTHFELEQPPLQQTPESQ